MSLPIRHIRGRIAAITLVDWPRIISAAHRLTPAGAGFGSSRFSSPTRAFRVLYAGIDFPTSFAEAVVRDRFEGKQRRFLYRPHLEELLLTVIRSTRPLRLVDLRGGAAYELGVDTDANHARNHFSGQAFSEEIHRALPDVDGILFNSRLTGGDCVAVYDRAFAALIGAPPVELLRAALLPAELARLKITVRRKRGLSPANP